MRRTLITVVLFFGATTIAVQGLKRACASDCDGPSGSDVRLDRDIEWYAEAIHVHSLALNSALRQGEIKVASAEAELLEKLSRELDASLKKAGEAKTAALNNSGSCCPPSTKALRHGGRLSGSMVKLIVAGLMEGRFEDVGEMAEVIWVSCWGQDKKELDLPGTSNVRWVISH